MTIPNERWRAVKMAQDLLHEIGYGPAPVPDLRERAQRILRHYPTDYEADMAQRREEEKP